MPTPSKIILANYEIYVEVKIGSILGCVSLNVGAHNEKKGKNTNAQ